MSRGLAGLAACAALLVGCTGQPGTPDAGGSPDVGSSPGTSTSPPATTSRTEPPVPPEPPEEAACYRFAYEELAETTTHHEPIACGNRHNAVTFQVGRLARVADGGAASSPRTQALVAQECERRSARYLGGSGSVRRLSRFHSFWFLPTAEEVQRGADWYRCDVVAFAAAGRLAQLPRPRRLAGVLDRPAALATYGLCGTAAPGSDRFERVICSRRHSWRAVSTIRIPGGDYPGVRAVRTAGEDRCRDLVRRMSSTPLRFRYGWEWPTREQWRHGQRYGYCWAPG